MNNWGESTDPRKHVFEDIAIAAFIIEYWKLNSFEPEKFEFRDLGCGNGLLVHILILEGYKGKGIDARARKSWALYPSEVQNCLLEQIIVPKFYLTNSQCHQMLPLQFKNSKYPLQQSSLKILLLLAIIRMSYPAGFPC